MEMRIEVLIIGKVDLRVEVEGMKIFNLEVGEEVIELMWGWVWLKYFGDSRRLGVVMISTALNDRSREQNGVSASNCVEPTYKANQARIKAVEQKYERQEEHAEA
ncbi:hypothetical protein Tco_0472712 [Tanacetum coccineum]